MKLSVVIVSYNVKFYLEQCLLSLKKALEGIEAEVIVVDNHSSDGTIEYLSDKFPSCNLISINHNLGFARANNIAIKQSMGEYVLLLNPDTIVGETTLKNVITFMDAHPNAGGAGVRMLKVDGTDAMESRRGLPTPATAFYKMCGLCARYPQSRRFGRYYMGYLSWDEPVRIDVVSGAFCMLRRSAIDKVGLLDTDFFMYGEDIDLSYRLLAGGYENWYLPFRILHYKGESTQKTSFRYVHVFYGAMLIFLRKHYKNMSLFLSLPIKTAIYGKALAELVRMNISKMRKNLGFSRGKKDVDPLYLFIGSRKATDQCRQIARKKGLEARFHEVTKKTILEGHAVMEMPANKHVYVVYDVDTIRYDDILNLFASHPIPNVSIGTYSVGTKTIITADEVLR